MTKSLFPMSAQDIKHAAQLLEGLDRYRLLLDDICEMEEIGLPVIVLSDNRQLRMDVSKDDFVALVNKNVTSIKDELDSLGVVYD